jgi:hypothetical protein
VTDFLDEKRDEIDGRLAELKPLVEEYNRLLAASAALRGVDGASGMSVGVIVPTPSPEPIQASAIQASVATSDGEGLTAEVLESEAPSVSTPADPELEPAPVRRGPGRPRGSASSKGREDNGDGVSSSDVDDSGAALASPSSSGGPRRAGRPKGSGTRAAEALRIVREHPGVTIPELADRMGIKQNYLYRVLPELVQEGKVAKQGRGWHPRAA